jgi:glycosyltransferase involved in cell wall biosynthesis
MSRKPLVVFYLGSGWESWDETSLEKGGIAGSETAAIWMGRELSKLGYQVKIFANPFSDHQDSCGEDVEYIHYSKWLAFAAKTDIDFFISSRTVAPFHHPLQAHRKYVWIHDVFLGKERDLGPVVESVDSYLCLSHWHKEFVHTYHNIPLEKIKITSNGIDPTRYLEDSPRNPYQIFYSSSPDRGLDTLLYMGEFIAKYVPLRIVVAYGFENWEKAAARRADPEEALYLARVKEALKKPYVQYLGRVDQKTLAKVQLESSGWFYPTRFYETFCITALEAGFSRNPILTSKHAGLTSTVKDGGILIEGDAYKKEYRQQFIEEALKLLTDKNYHEEWSYKAYERMRGFIWAAVALQWHRMFEQGIFEELC